MSTRSDVGGSPSLLHPDYWWYAARQRMLLQVFSDHISPHGSILDVGSADGPSVFWDHTLNTVVSVDPDPRGLSGRAVRAELPHLPFRDASFDIVTAFDVLEHCADESAALVEVSRVLRPSGKLLLTVPAYQWIWSEHDVANGHYRRYTRKRATRALEDAGFVVHRATYAFSTVFPAFVLSRLPSALRVKRGLGMAGPSDIVDVPQTNHRLAGFLMRLCRVDEEVLQRSNLPFGSSIIVAASIGESSESDSMK